MTEEDGLLPESNVDNVAINLWSQSIDLDGHGLVSILQTLLKRAEEIRDMRARSMEANAKRMEDIASITAGDLRTDMYEGHFEPRCLKWFIGRVCKHLANEFDYEMEGQQRHGKRIAKIEFGPEGSVESYILSE